MFLLIVSNDLTQHPFTVALKESVQPIQVFKYLHVNAPYLTRGNLQATEQAFDIQMDSPTWKAKIGCLKIEVVKIEESFADVDVSLAESVYNDVKEFKIF